MNIGRSKYELLKQLCMTPGVPGREDRVRTFIQNNIRAGNDVEDFVDDMGNLHYIRRADSSSENTKTVMIACHMDEIGFMVNYIDPNGFISVVPLGGFDPRNLFSRRVKIVTEDDEISAVMNPEGLPIHLSKPEDRAKVPAADEFILDTGLDKDTVHREISIGDFVVMDEPFMEMGNKLVSKALDNRVACYMGMKLIRALEDSYMNVDVHVVFTVQEEVGLRGAKTATVLVNPDIAIGVDVTLSCDTPGVPPKKYVTTQGKGCAIGVRDSSFISDKSLVEYVTGVAEQYDIDYQHVVSSGGGMDGAAMQQSAGGCSAIAISVGTRYIHTVTEMVDTRDLDAGLKLLVRTVRGLS